MENNPQATLSDLQRTAIQIEIDRELTQAVHDEWLIAQMAELIPPIIYHHKPPLDERPRMSAIERLKAKALEARNVVPDAIKKFEADLDSIIAEKEGIETKREAAVAPHKDAIQSVKGELDGLKGAMDILTNGNGS